MIDGIRGVTGHPIRVICTTLEVPRSSYYHAAQPTATQRSDGEPGAVIETIFREHRGRCGYRRIYEELAPGDITCAPERVRRIMKERGLKALQPKRFTPATSDGRADRPSLNLLLNQPLFLAGYTTVWNWLKKAGGVRGSGRARFTPKKTPRPKSSLKKACRKSLKRLTLLRAAG